MTENFSDQISRIQEIFRPPRLPTSFYYEIWVSRNKASSSCGKSGVTKCLTWDFRPEFNSDYYLRYSALTLLRNYAALFQHLRWHIFRKNMRIYSRKYNIDMTVYKKFLFSFFREESCKIRVPRFQLHHLMFFYLI